MRPDAVDGRRVVLGVGNLDRGDDAAGRFVARRLREAQLDDVEIIEKGGEATQLLAALEAASAAFIVDACASGVEAGALRRFDVAAQPLPSKAFALSSHGLGLAETIELARALGRLPPVCVVYAIEGESFETGAPLSPKVAAAITGVVEKLRAEIVTVAKQGEERDA
ncbi:MAG: hydrogenase maturation protease [Alphaproteobacteria bacterium]|nr:hydrogenase maturation protease [Alphaproteobacteria bacterium]